MREDRIAADRWRRAFWTVWSLLLLAKLWFAASLPLFGDEAFYWLESRHPALAYDDVPGLTAWLIRLGTTLFGQHEWALRLPFIVLAAVTAVMLMWAVAARHGQVAGAQAGTVALLLPLFAANGLLALPDVPLTLAVLLCAVALQRLLDSDGSAGRGLLALALALGWLSHYRFLVPFAAGGAWLLFDPAGRRLLARPAVWRAGLLGTAAGLAPLLWQQWASGGRGFAFQFAERHPWRFQPAGLADPLLQAIPTTPGLYLLLLAVLLAGWRRRRQFDRAVLGVGTALLLLFLALAPFADTERSRLHWLLPAWLLLAMLLPSAWRGWGAIARRLGLLAIGSAALVVAGLFGYLALAAHAPQRLAGTDLYPEHSTGWSRIAERVRGELAGLPADTVVAADNFMLAAALGFELGGRPVYALDHPGNRKHGRQGELVRFGLDETALLQLAASRPVLLVADDAATGLRERPDWFARICAVLPQAAPRFTFAFDHGRKRVRGWLQQPGVTADCVPAPVAYLHEPLLGAVVSGELRISGWAIRDRVGIDRLWLKIDGAEFAELAYGLPEPGVRQQFPASDDPNHPQVGFALRLAPTLAPGRHWLGIEADSAGERSLIVSVPFDWRP